MNRQAHQPAWRWWLGLAGEFLFLLVFGLIVIALLSLV